MAKKTVKAPAAAGAPKKTSGKAATSKKSKGAEQSTKAPVKKATPKGDKAPGGKKAEAKTGRTAGEFVASAAAAKKSSGRSAKTAGTKKPMARAAKDEALAAETATVAAVGHDAATKKSTKKHGAQLGSFSDALRVGPGFQLSELDADSTPAFDGGHKKAEKLMRKTGDELADLQEQLYASQRHPGGRSVLLVVQGMDTSGKGGIMRHVIGDIDPQGVELTSFKAPTKEEQAHPFLWRIRNALPKPGYLGVFDRSQYEDVLVVRVHDLVSRPVWMRRYGQINSFEASLVAKHTTIIKVMLHIDADEQKERLAERLDNPEKYYKYNPGDLVERSYWNEYQEAYQAVLERTSTEYAPWYVVPANHKWYARLAVQQLLLEHLRALDLEWPEATFDVEKEKARLAEL